MLHANTYTRKLLKLFQSRKARSVFAILIGASLVFGLTAYFASRFSKRLNPVENRIAASVFNQGSSGAAAFRELLNVLHIPTGTIMRTTDRFASETEGKEMPGALIFLEPESPLEKKEILHFKEIAEKGINIIVFTSGEEKIAGIMHTLSADRFPKVREGMYLAEVKNATAKIEIAPAPGVGKKFTLHLPAKKRFRTFHRDWEVHARDAQGVFMVRKSYRRGSLILASDGEFASNLFIGKEDNGLFAFRLVSALAENKGVFFDEYHHGYNRRFTLLYFIAQKDYALFIAHAALLFLLSAAASFVRFGRSRTTETETGGRIFFFTKGMAALLSKRRFAGNLAGVLARTLSAAPASAKHDSAHKRRLLLSERLREKINRNSISFKDIKITLQELRREEHGDQGIRRENQKRDFKSRHRAG